MPTGFARKKAPRILATSFIAVAALLLAGIRARPQAATPRKNQNPVTSYLKWQPAPPDMQLHLMAALSLRHAGEIESLKQQLQRPASPSFHKWLTSVEFERRFGPTAKQMESVTAWLRTRGFSIESADLQKWEVRFSGSAAQVQQALGVRFVSSGSKYANLNDPQVPAILAGSVVAFLGLDNLSVPGNAEAGPQTDFSFPDSTASPHFAPQDFWHFYDESPPVNGQGRPAANGGTEGPDCIALLEKDTLPTVPSPAPSPTVPSGCSLTPAPTDTATGIVNIFTNQFCLPAAQIQVISTDPSQPPGQPSDDEPNLDVIWAHAIAPSTPIKVYVSTNPNSTTPALDTLKAAVNDRHLCGAISSSVDDRGASGSSSPCPSKSVIQAYENVEARAVIQGQTVFHSSGDFGANYACGQPNNQSGPTTTQPSIEESWASSDVTVVGGTQFNPTYDANGNNVSVLVPHFEQVWQFATPVPAPVSTPAKGASGGGISSIIPRPLWQLGLVPYGTNRPLRMRAVPDVSIAASAGSPGYWIASTGNIESKCPSPPSPCFVSTGGTSASSPVWAGISRLVAQNLIKQHRGTRFMGNINPRLYLLAALRSPAFVDVSVLGTNCSVDSSGICETPQFYQTGPGYDLGTGLGSPDINKLISAFGFLP